MMKKAAFLILLAILLFWLGFKTMVDYPDPYEGVKIVYSTQDFGYVSGSAFFDDYVVVVGENGLAILDVSKLDDVKVIKSFKTDDVLRDVFVSEGLAYVTTGRIKGVDGRLRIFNISKPSKATEIRNGLVFPENTLGVKVAGDLAYVAGYGAGFFIVNVSDCANPFIVSNYSLKGTANLTATGERVRENAKKEVGEDPERAQKVAERLGLESVDDLLSHMDGMGPGHAWFFDMRFPYAFVCFDSLGLRILDVSNPASPRLVGTYNKVDPDGSPNYFNGAAVNGDYAYLAVDHRGLITLDISDVKAPFETSHLLHWDYVVWKDRPGSLVQTLVVDDLLFASAAKDGLYIYSLKDPGHPELVKKFSNSAQKGKGAAWGLSTNGRLVGVSYTLEKSRHPIKGAFEIFKIN